MAVLLSKTIDSKIILWTVFNYISVKKNLKHENIRYFSLKIVEKQSLVGIRCSCQFLQESALHVMKIGMGKVPKVYCILGLFIEYF